MSTNNIGGKELFIRTLHMFDISSSLVIVIYLYATLLKIYSHFYLAYLSWLTSINLYLMNLPTISKPLGGPELIICYTI